MKKIITLSVASFAATVCFAQSGKLTITGTVTDSTLNGKYLYLTEYAKANFKDSCKVEDYKFKMEVSPKDVVMLRLQGNRSYANIIAQEGVVNINFSRQSTVNGTPLNDVFNEYNSKILQMNKEFSDTYKALKEKQAPDSEIEAAYTEFQNKANSYQGQVVAANEGNNVGLIVLNGMAYDMSLDELKAAAAKFGKMAENYTPLQNQIKSKENFEKTKAGSMFIDFDAVNPDGSPAKLSDYVGKGNYVLADFWASWCGPCRAEVPHIKEVYEKYKDKGLVVLGVNVWDKKDACEKTIKDLDMSWAHICNFDSNNPTDTYGINGIPHIILFGPDGTIVERNLRGEGMKAKIAEIYAGK